MITGVLTVGTSAVEVPVTGTLQNGLRLLARSANSGTSYVGIASDVTITTGNLLNQGNPGETPPYTVPATHFNSSRKVYVIGSASGQLIDYSYD